MNIYLIGMPGAGKTTIGKELAKQLNYRFIDLDHEIERNSLMFIDEFFEKYGEATFRIQEKKALSDISGDNLVISTGGGIVKDRTNKALMNGIKVYIDTDITLIENRIENDYPRPLLKNKSLDTLYQERMLSYVFFADLIVSNDGNVLQTTTKLRQLLKEKFNV